MAVALGVLLFALGYVVTRLAAQPEPEPEHLGPDLHGEAEPS